MIQSVILDSRQLSGLEFGLYDSRLATGPSEVVRRERVRDAVEMRGTLRARVSAAMR